MDWLLWASLTCIGLGLGVVVAVGLLADERRLPVFVQRWFDQREVDRAEGLEVAAYLQARPRVRVRATSRRG